MLSIPFPSSTVYLSPASNVRMSENLYSFRIQMNSSLTFRFLVFQRNLNFTKEKGNRLGNRTIISLLPRVKIGCLPLPLVLVDINDDDLPVLTLPF